MQDYRKLHVWRKAHAHNLNVRNLAKRFPLTGYASLKAQITSATESIAFNIVEGSAASSRKEFARFLDISIKSATETEYQLQLARDYSVVSLNEWESLADETVQIRKMLCRLRAKLLEHDE